MNGGVANSLGVRGRNASWLEADHVPARTWSHVLVHDSYCVKPSVVTMTPFETGMADKRGPRKRSHAVRI